MNVTVNKANKVKDKLRIEKVQRSGMLQDSVWTKWTGLQ